jgi:hypothetical protein
MLATFSGSCPKAKVVKKDIIINSRISLFSNITERG